MVFCCGVILVVLICVSLNPDRVPEQPLGCPQRKVEGSVETDEIILENGVIIRVF